MALIQFTRNYHDLSTDAGFQFEFYCAECGTKQWGSPGEELLARCIYNQEKC